MLFLMPMAQRGSLEVANTFISESNSCAYSIEWKRAPMTNHHPVSSALPPYACGQPLGLVLEEDERGNVYVVEIYPGGNASRNKEIYVSLNRCPVSIDRAFHGPG